MKKKNGFTLVELLAVVVVLAIIALVLVPVIGSIIEKVKMNAVRTNARGLLEAGNIYYAAHMDNMPEPVQFEIVEGVQTGSEKLDFSGKVNTAYLMLFPDNTKSICVDDGVYVATKTLDSDDILVEEGICSNEYDENLLGYVTVGNDSVIGTKLSVKAYSSVDDLPNKAHEGYIGIITDTKVADYYLMPTAPENPKEGSTWLVLDNSSTNYIITKTTKLGVGYALQYENGNWNLKEAYVYNDDWDQLSDFSDDLEWDYSYSGHYETFEAPYSGYYNIELWGAQGGNYNATYVGGLGAYTSGEIYLNKAEKIYIYVGGQGKVASAANGGAGWNGGGVNDTYVSSYSIPGSGGATDIRTIATSGATAWNEITSLRSRIMVAAGGGSGTFYNGGGAKGGAGGGLTSETAPTIPTPNAHYYATGATQVSGGYNSTSNISLGTFGAGGVSETQGGGGWYGGGGSYSYIPPGSGGSSYISGHAGCNSVTGSGLHTGSSISYTGKYFINTEMIDGDGYKWTTMRGSNTGMPKHDGEGSMTGNTGHGYAKISFVRFDSLDANAYASLAASIQTEWQFSYVGQYQQFVVPKTGNYKVELWGAQGGNYNTTYVGGLGAYTSGNIHLTKGEVFYVYVGGQGKVASAANGGAGWNGGGVNDSYVSNYNTPGSGGATDIRTIVTSSANVWNEIASLRSRIMVAAGGGSGTYYNGGGAKGGAGGGLSSSTAPTMPTSGAHYYATGATQIAGGSNSTSNISVGTFGVGGVSETQGGGGWYGGGGSYSYIPPGSGGSSYISGHKGCVAVKETGEAMTVVTPTLEESYSLTGYKFTNTEMIDGDGYKWTDEKKGLVQMPTQDGLTKMVGNTGNGYAKITYLGN